MTPGQAVGSLTWSVPAAAMATKAGLASRGRSDARAAKAVVSVRTKMTARPAVALRLRKPWRMLMLSSRGGPDRAARPPTAASASRLVPR